MLENRQNYCLIYGKSKLSRYRCCLNKIACGEHFRHIFNTVVESSNGMRANTITQYLSIFPTSEKLEPKAGHVATSIIYNREIIKMKDCFSAGRLVFADGILAIDNSNISRRRTVQMNDSKN